MFETKKNLRFAKSEAAPFFLLEKQILRGQKAIVLHTHAFVWQVS